MSREKRDDRLSEAARWEDLPAWFLSGLTRFVRGNPRITVASSGGGANANGITANWSGVLITVPGTGTSSRVPELSGASHTWSLTKAYVRYETAGTGDTTLVIEKMSPDSDGTWSTATTVAVVTVAAGHYETTATISASVTTGDLLRVRWTAIGTTGLFTVEATGS